MPQIFSIGGKEIAARLKSAIASDVRNYVNEVLREFD